MDDMLGSDDEDAHDAYLERMKREGQEAESDDDEDSSEGNSSLFVSLPILSLLYYTIYSPRSSHPLSVLHIFFQLPPCPSVPLSISSSHPSTAEPDLIATEVSECSSKLSRK